MNKKLFKKALTAVLTAALLFTSSGFASLNASAAEKIYVEGVYTNFQKATMSTGTSRQINAYVEPSNATVQVLQYKSSAPEVASVSSTGLISALSPGKATITVTALDGSSQTEKIKITVLEDLFITGDMVDSDNDVVVLDKTYGNLYIDGSVGDADIYLSGVTVRNILAMGSGDYSLYTYESSIKELILDDVAGEIESFAITDEDDKAAPNLIVGENTQINNLNARISASIRQEDGSAIEGLRVTQDAEGRLTVYLENYSGGLLLDSSLGDMEIITTGCSLSSVNVTGSEDAGNIHLVNGGDSEISNLILSGAANVTLDVPAAQVDIDRDANGAALTSNSDIGALTDAGSGSNITVAGSIDSFEANGSGSNINVASGGYVGMINLNGEGSKLSGAGTVSEAYVNANNVSVDTVNTLIVVGNVSGTKVQGKSVAGGSTVATEPPGSGGGGGPFEPQPDKPIRVGDVLYKNNFNDRKNDLGNSAQGSVTITLVDESGRGKVAYVTSKQADWAGACINLDSYTKKRITIRLKADIKFEPLEKPEETIDFGDLKASIKHYDESQEKNTYEQVAKQADANANEWYTIEGTYELKNNFKTALIYFESPDMTNYYLDNIEITIDRIGDPIRVTGISLDKDTMSLDIGSSDTLAATVTPQDADNKNVTWQSSKPAVATVTDGVVRGISAGTANIIVTSQDGSFTAECVVTVSSNVALKIDHKTVVLQSIGDSRTVQANVDGITWATLDSAVATVANGEVTATGLGTTIVTATLGEKTVSCEVVVSDKIVYYGDFEDGTHPLISKGSWASEVTVITDSDKAYNGNKYLCMDIKNAYNGDKVLLDNSTGTQPATFVITSYVRAESDNIDVRYVNESGGYVQHGSEVIATANVWSKLESTDIVVPAGSTLEVRITSGVVGKYFVDCLYITKSLPDTSGVQDADYVTFDFETGAATTSAINVTASVVSMDQMKADVAESKVLRAEHTGDYNSLPKFTINLPMGTSLSDYTKLSAKYYLANDASAYKDALLFIGTPIDYNGYKLEENCFAKVTPNGFAGKGAWRTVTFDLDSAKAATVSGSAIEVGIGMNALSGAIFMLDDITLQTVSGSAIVVEDFEGASPTFGKVGGGAAITTTIGTMSDFYPVNTSNYVLKLTNTSFHDAVKLSITLDNGNKLSDYASLKFKFYLPANVVDQYGFNYKKFTISIGSNITSVEGTVDTLNTLNEVRDTGGDNVGRWIEWTSVITPEIKALIGDETSFEIALGCSQNFTANSYYLDDITLVPISPK